MKKIIEQRRRLRRAALSSAIAAVYMGGVGTTEMKAQAIFREDFEGLTLGPSIEEPNARGQVWTHTPPASWTQDDSKMPGVGNPALDGITEWVGWSFANKNWWWRFVDNQDRQKFEYGTGTVMMADNDEWDDAVHAKGFFEATITTKPIDVTGAEANSLVLVYDSSWRPEAKDDGSSDPRQGFPQDAEGNNYNDQTAVVSAKFDNGGATEIQRWTSVNTDATYHDHLPNEVVTIPLNNPAGATSLSLKFGEEKAANDWWWAVDNIAVGVPPFAYSITNSGTAFAVRIAQTTGKTVDQSKGVALELDGQAVTSTLETDGDILSALSTQSQVFAPGSPHTVKAKYTSSAGKAMEDTLQFVAPRYVDLPPGPNLMIPTIWETEWMKVDESKGVKLSLDGTSLTPVAVTVNDTDGSVTAVAGHATPLAPNTAHSLAVTYTTDAGQELTETVQFTTQNYPTLPTSLATAVGTGAEPGMKWRSHLQDTSVEGTLGRLPILAEAEAQLKGTNGPSIHDPTGQGADGYFPIDFVNFDKAAAAAGHFNNAAAAPENVSDLSIPGVPDDGKYITGEARTFVEFPAPGVYTIVVNHREGFQLSAGTTNNPTQTIIGKFDGTRQGTADTVMYLKVDQAGVYDFRLIWYNNNGDSRVEWFTVNPDGTRALVNGTQTGSLKTFRIRTVPEPSGPPSGPGQPADLGQTVAGFQDDFTGATRDPDWQAFGPGGDHYVQADGLLYVSPSVGDPNHLLYMKAGYSNDVQEVLARIRATAFGPMHDYPRGGLAVGVQANPTNLTANPGYNLHFRDSTQDNVPGRQFKLLDDARAWGPPGLRTNVPPQTTPGWTNNVWYWLRLRVAPKEDGTNNLYGKVWAADGATAEPTDWQLRWSDSALPKPLRTGFAGIAGSSVDTSNNGLGHFEVDYVLIKAAGLPQIKVDFQPTGPAPTVPEFTGITKLAGNKLQIGWIGAGTLEQADTVTGPYTAVPASSALGIITPSGAAKFYRLHQQ